MLSDVGGGGQRVFWTSSLYFFIKKKKLNLRHDQTSCQAKHIIDEKSLTRKPDKINELIMTTKADMKEGPDNI